MAFTARLLFTRTAIAQRQSGIGIWQSLRLAALLAVELFKIHERLRLNRAP
jgi:hypothetical protein